MTVKEFAEKAEISLSLAYLLVAEGSVPTPADWPEGETRGDPDF